MRCRPTPSPACSARSRSRAAATASSPTCATPIALPLGSPSSVPTLRSISRRSRWCRPSYRDPLGTFATNVQGTANFLEGCRGVDTLRAVVVVTTDKCYLNRERLAPYEEDEPLGGHDPYSASKACAEIVTQAYRLSFFGDRDAAKIASARGGNVFGGGDWCQDRLVPDAVRAFAAGDTVAIRNPGRGAALAACDPAARRLPHAGARPVRRRAGLCDRLQFRTAGRPGAFGAHADRANGRGLGRRRALGEPARSRGAARGEASHARCQPAPVRCSHGRRRTTSLRRSRRRSRGTGRSTAAPVRRRCGGSRPSR